MIFFLATIMLQVPTQDYVIPESVARYCAKVVGIPYASLLTALIFMLTIAQIG